jgi:hypothetical protein
VLALPETRVYLAIRQEIYEKFFAQAAIQIILQKYKILLLIVDTNQSEIVQWIN